MQAEIQNIAQSLEVFSTNLSLEWDERDYPQAPKNGSWYRVTQSFYSARDREGQRDLQSFRKIDFDLRRYFSLAEDWTLAAQAFASEAQGDQIPFQYLNFIGGGSRLRGYYSGQYRDNALGMLQSEVRYEWSDRWTLAAFAGVARLATKISELTYADSFYSGGVGVHYFLDPENRTKLRLDVGTTGHESGAYFLVGEAF